MPYLASMSILPNDVVEVLLRLLAAMLIGSLLGINRDLHGKPIGLRTLSLVCLGTCLISLIIVDMPHPQSASNLDAVSRVIQGILAGIGFLGAGVIMHDRNGVHVKGLTTAATIWMAAALGVACGLGAWLLAIAGVSLALLVLVLGGPLEKLIHQKLKPDDLPPSD